MGELVNARTAAERLGVDVRTLYAYVSRGALRRVPGPDGRSSRYDSDELDLLARRSRPRTLPRPAASIDLVIATRVSTVTDGMVRYRGTDVLDLVKAEAAVRARRRPALAGRPARTDARWRLPGAGERPAFPLPDEIPVLHRFAIAVAATDRCRAASDVAAPWRPPTSTPDWPSCGRRVIGRLIDASAAADRDCAGAPDRAGRHIAAASVARRLWQRWSPLPPTAARVRALDIALVLLAEHELALSTLSVRVAASARATPASCLLAGLSTLSGSLHGGAARTVHDKLAAREPRRDRVRPPGPPARRSPGDAAARGRLRRRDRPRTARSSRPRGGRPPRPLNVDFALGALTYAARMPAEAATAIFAIARVAGWIAHAAEEYDEPPLRFRGRAVRPARGGWRSPSGG